eukprot:TRINITY_DN7467_c0_g1_i3.p1 TRINITY_DN7467_c0_g1~~TRINITY_DN7467_c0_g1_i3.p1  ORF type:complete len:225 (+),score=73.15 TRINITY_DN7467_c0_g1_i3:15-689(+)
MSTLCYIFFFFQAEDGIRDLVRSRGLGDVYKRQVEQQEKTTADVHNMSRMSQAAYATFVLSRGQLGPAFPELCEWACSLALDESDSEVQCCALSKFGAIVAKLENDGLQDQLVDALLQVLSSELPDIQETSLEQLKACAKQDTLAAARVREVVSAVFPLTKVKSFVVKEAAKRAMMYLLQVPRGDEATRAVLSSLGAESSTMRDYVARTLRKLAAEGDSDDDTA